MMGNPAMRNRGSTKSVNRKISKLLRARFITPLILGGVVFLGNSSLELPYFLRGYLTILEAQLGLALLYIFTLKRHQVISVEKHHEE
jgi:hypothetical protein